MVRLRHIQLPEEARDLDKELKQLGYGLLVVLLNAVEPRSSHILSLTKAFVSDDTAHGPYALCWCT
jgi:hypothetical protein